MATTTFNRAPSVSINALVALADTTTGQEIKKEFNIDLIAPDIRTALAELQAEEKKNAARAAAKEIMTLIQMTEQVKLGEIQKIRNARSIVEYSKQKLAAIEEATAYATSSNNYLPLCVALGVPVGQMNIKPELTVIPVKAAAKTARK